MFHCDLLLPGCDQVLSNAKNTTPLICLSLSLVDHQRSRARSCRFRQDGWPWYCLPHRECSTILVRCVVGKPRHNPSFADALLLELEDILKIPGNASLSLLDTTLKRSIAFCASYHGMLPTPVTAVLCSCLAPVEQYLQSPLQLEHACNFILDSELFAFHSERMCEILTDEVAVVSLLCVIPSCPDETDVISIRIQIRMRNSCCTIFCFTMADVTRSSSAHTSTGSS